MNIFQVTFWVIFFFLLMGAGFGYFIQTGVSTSMSFGNISGLEAFILANLVLWIVLGFIVAIIWWSRST
jgi:hypothetical protein